MEHYCDESEKKMYASVGAWEYEEIKDVTFSALNSTTKHALTTVKLISYSHSVLQLLCYE